MTMISLGDLAQSLMLRHHNAAIRQDVARLAEEVTTGLTADVAGRLSGDFSYLADIERNLATLKAYGTSVSEAETFASGMQAALGQVQQVTSDLSLVLLQDSGGTPAVLSPALARAAADGLDRVVDLLNTRVAGRSLFAGNETGRPALAPAEAIRAELRLLAAGPMTAQDLRTAVDGWFDTPAGGFESTAYTGAPQGLGPFRLAAGETVDLDLRGDSAAIRGLLKQVALATLATDPSVSLSMDARADLMRQSAEGLLAAQDDLTALRGDLGFAEARIEERKVRLASERSSFDMARSALLGVDQFDTASKLTQAQQQLESLYAVTARLSRLSLSDFLR